MGACASKPKDLNKHDAAIPEAPVTPKKPDVQFTPEVLNNDGEETMKEEPLVDLSEPAPEAPKAEKEAEAVTEVAEAKTDDAPKAPAV